MIKTVVPANLDKRTIYAITHMKAYKMSDFVESTITPTAVIITETADKKVAFLAVVTDEIGTEVYATNSRTFIESLEEILDTFENDLSAIGGIYITSGTSRAGRPYIDCGLAVM